MSKSMQSRRQTASCEQAAGQPPIRQASQHGAKGGSPTPLSATASSLRLSHCRHCSLCSHCSRIHCRDYRNPARSGTSCRARPPTLAPLAPPGTRCSQRAGECPVMCTAGLLLEQPSMCMCAPPMPCCPCRPASQVHAAACSRSATRTAPAPVAAALTASQPAGSAPSPAAAAPAKHLH